MALAVAAAASIRPPTTIVLRDQPEFEDFDFDAPRKVRRGGKSDPCKSAKRKAQRKARRITRNHR